MPRNSLRRLLGAVLTATAVLTGATVTDARADELAANIESRIRKSFEQSDVPGMVAVVVNGDRVVWSGGEGTASDGAQMTADSAVQVASLTKSFTATAVLELVEAGRVRLDGPVSAQLSEFTMSDPRAAQITVRQLLTHTSGLTDAGTRYYRTINDGAATPRDVVATLGAERLSTDPGTRQRYANINYVLAGRLVEVVTGRPFHDQLWTQVLEPLGLRDTALDWDGAPAGQNSIFGRWVSRRDTSSALRHDPAGALVTTASDLGDWLIASNGNGPTPLSAPVRQQLEKTTPTSGAYGAGWARDEHLDGWWNHGGNRYTYSAAMLRNPTSGWGVAVAVNGASMTDPAYAIAQDLASLVSGGDPVDVPSATAIDRWALLVAAIGVALSTIGVLRSHRWAQRRRGQPARTALGLGWLLPPIALALALPPIAGRLVGGIDMSWSMLSYYSLTPMLLILGTALGCAAVLISRIVALRLR